MPNEVIEQVHRLAAAAEIYERIVFTDVMVIYYPTKVWVTIQKTKKQKTQKMTQPVCPSQEWLKMKSTTYMSQLNINETVNIMKKITELTQKMETINYKNPENEAINVLKVYDSDDEIAKRMTIDYINVSKELNTSQMTIQKEEHNMVEATPTYGYNVRRFLTNHNRQHQCENRNEYIPTGDLAGRTEHSGGHTYTWHGRKS